MIPDKKTAAVASFALGAILLALFFHLQAPNCNCGTQAEVFASPGAEAKIISLIRSAKDTIDIEMYLFTSEDVALEIGNAVKRGVKVRIILEPRIDDSRKHKMYAILEELGADVRWASFSYKLTHSKIIIIDGKIAIVGSMNLSESALNYNREVAVLLEGDAVKELTSIFEEDWRLAQEAYPTAS